MQFSQTSEVSLSDATKPLLIFSRLVGMNPKSNWHKMYTVFILVCEISIFCYIWLYYTRQDYKNYFFNIFVHALYGICRVILLLIILGLGLFDRKRFMIPLKDFENIDRNLKKLGGCIDNRCTYRRELLQFFFLGLTSLFFSFMKISSESSIVTDHKMYIIFVVAWFFNLSIMVICVLADCSFSATLSIIRKRFEAINSIIGRATEHGSYLKVNSIEVLRVNSEHHVLGDLKILRKQYHNLWKIGYRANEAYGPHLLVGITTSLALMTSKLWEIYSTYVNSDLNTLYATVENISWVLFCFARMFLLVNTCESTIREAKATTAIVLQEFEMKEDHNQATKAEIRDFLMQLQFETRSFTACGFFDIDFTLICGILGAACTYLVILIQMAESNSTTGVANENIHHENGEDDS